MRGTGRSLPGWDLWEPTPRKECRTSPLPRTSRATAQRSGFTHTHPGSHTHCRTRRDDAPSPAAPRNFPSCPRAPALVPSPPAPRTHLPRRLSGPRGCGGVRDGPAGAGGAGGARSVPAGSDTRLTARGWKAPRDLTSDPLSSHRARRTLPHRPEAETNFAPSVASYAHPRGRVRGVGGFAPPTRRRGRARGTSFLRPPTLGMPHGPGRGRGGGTRTPGVSLGAGSSPLLLSESVSGAPTVCTSLGVGRRRGAKGASPRTSVETSCRLASE
ncbi:hypothetical protein LEMLEM_LOCUS363 [Lemmus lemmus]